MTAPTRKAAKKAAPKAPAKKPNVSENADKAAIKKPAPAKAAGESAPKRPPGSQRVEKTRVVIPMDVYESRKDALKAPLKAHELKWNFLGEGKGLYKRADNGVHCFTQFKDDGVHYSIWGEDKPRLSAILASWRSLLGEPGWSTATTSGEQAGLDEKKEQESDALRLWRLAEPHARPGEPELFLKRRLAEWQGKKPV